MPSADSKVYGFLALGLATFATAPIVVRLGAGADPIAMTTVRTVAAALVLLPIWWFHAQGRISSKSNLRDWGWSALAGLFLASHFALWISSLSHTSVASASVLVTSHPILLILIESVFFRVRFSRLTWIGVFMAFTGSIALAWLDRDPTATYSDPLFGNLLAFTAACMFVGYILIGRNMSSKSTWLDQVTRIYSTTAVASVAIAVVVGTTWADFSLPAVSVGLGLAFGAQLIGHGALNYAVKSVPPTLLSTLILAEPLFATLLAAVLFAEWPGLPSGAAMGLTLAGIVAAWWGRGSASRRKS